MRWSWLGLGGALAVAGCDDHLFGAGGGEGPPLGEGWCATAGLIAEQCVGCHSAAGAAGGLDLETDAWAALVDAPSATGGTLVVPGDPDASALIGKLEGTAPGGQMPPGAPLDAATIDAVRAWIADGADAACDDVPGTGDFGMHPPSWPDPSEHGIAAKFAVLSCATGGCHGEDLLGDAGPACASCHDAVVPDWTASCTFCHGDRETGDPAPGEDLDDNADRATLSFPPHDLHLAGSDLHADWDCTQCHTVPTDTFSPGHNQFGGDGTPGAAEVVFSAGLGAGGRYEGGACGVYCHDPLGEGTEIATDGDVACGGCHPVTIDAWDARPGAHGDHLDELGGCLDCHPTSDGERILRPAVHVDGALTLDLPAGMQRVDGQCTGECHGEPHNGRRWVD